MATWTKISGKCFQHLDESMTRKMTAVLKAKGGPTFYQQGVPNKVACEWIVATISELNQITFNLYLHC